MKHIRIIIAGILLSVILLVGCNPASVTNPLVYEGKLTKVEGANIATNEFVLQFTFDETKVLQGIPIKEKTSNQVETEFYIGSTYRVYADGVAVYDGSQRYRLEKVSNLSLWLRHALREFMK